MSVLAYDQLTVCTATKECEGISTYAYLFMFLFFSGGGEKWGMKDEKKVMIGEGVLGAKPPRSQSILMPEKEMGIIFVTPPPMDS